MHFFHFLVCPSAQGFSPFVAQICLRECDVFSGVDRRLFYLGHAQPTSLRNPKTIGKSLGKPFFATERGSRVQGKKAVVFFRVFSRRFGAGFRRAGLENRRRGLARNTANFFYRGRMVPCVQGRFFRACSQKKTAFRKYILKGEAAQRPEKIFSYSDAIIDAIIAKRCDNRRDIREKAR